MFHTRLNPIGVSNPGSRVLYAVVLGMLATGCAAPGPRGALPLGEWTGEGSFVMATWKEEAESRAFTEKADRDALAAEQGRYPTSLSIRLGRLEGREVIEIEIVSEHGGLGGDDAKRTHIRLALAEMKRVSETTVLYRIIAASFDPDGNTELSAESNSPVYTASCHTQDGTTTLVINYRENFVDTFRFRGDELEKAGAFFNFEDGDERGLIHWYERLRREK